MYDLASNDWYMKYFENGGKNMSFVIKDDDVLDKHNEIWGKIRETLSIKFHSMPVYDKKYMKAKVREFNGVIRTKFSVNKIPKENMHYTCIDCITINSVSILRMEKKNYPQVYLEQCKYRTKKTKMTKFIETELKSESESESEIELELRTFL